MFAVLERNGEMKAVYSKVDLEYMQRLGWTIKNLSAEPPKMEVIQKKRGRPAKDK